MKITGYCYHLINRMRYGLAQSDPIKRHLPNTVVDYTSNKVNRKFETNSTISDSR